MFEAFCSTVKVIYNAVRQDKTRPDKANIISVGSNNDKHSLCIAVLADGRLKSDGYSSSRIRLFYSVQPLCHQWLLD